MNDEIVIYDHAPLDDCINLPAYFSQAFAQHLAATGITISQQRQVNPGTGNLPAILELSVPTGSFSALDTATKDFLNSKSIPYHRQAVSAGAQTIIYTFPRPTSSSP